MKLDVEGLEAFVVIAEFGSFHRAAAALHLSQSGLSRRMKKIEETAGVRLLDRTTQKVELTAVGKAFLPQARRLVMELRAAAESLGDTTYRRSGRIAVACIPTAAAHFLPSAIGAYSRDHPDVQVRVLDQSSGEVMDSVVRGVAEFGIGFVEKPPYGLEFELLFEDPFVLICHREHPLAARARVSWNELEPHRIARIGPRSGTGLLLDLALNRLGLQLKWFHEVEYHFSSALGLSEQGAVVTVLPRLAFAGQVSSALVARPLINPSLSRRLGIVRRKGETLSPLSEGLIEALRHTGRKTRMRTTASSQPSSPKTAGRSAKRAGQP